MKDMANFYADNLHDQFENYYATWLPGTPLELGDYGEMDDHLFIKVGNITRDFGIPVDTHVDKTNDTYEYTSSGSVKIECIGDAGTNIGTVGKAEATVKVSFSDVNAIYFYANKCKCNSITNIKTIGEALLNNRGWREKHRIITEIIEAGATTVLISGEKGAEITFGIKGRDISVANFVSAGMKVSIKSQKFSGLKVITQRGLKPLFRVRKIDRPGIFDRDGDFRAADIILPERGET